jgi:nucleoside-diphosphate-sugar epimerase
MNVLAIGGSGFLGGLVLARLAENHRLRVYDRRPPGDPTLDYVIGDACDFNAVARAAEGMDAVLYMAMGRYVPYGTDYPSNVDALEQALDANVKGVFLSLHAARSAGVTHAVYTSSMSVYHDVDLTTRHFPDEEITPDAVDVYGFTKGLGEESCRNVWRLSGMSVNVLRLCWPLSETEWRARARPGVPILAMADSDIARLLDAALEYRAGFQIFNTSGDYENRIMSMSKVKRMLGWEPRMRPDPVEATP